MAKANPPAEIGQRLIAVIDDEPDILELVSINLKRASFQTETFITAGAFYEFLKRRTPDLIILDLMLPDVDGIEVCRFLKSQPDYAHIPIIMLTARAEETDRVLGLELGADDYITKPFSPRELVARVRSVLRRLDTIRDEDRITVAGILTINPKRHEVEVDGKKVFLTTTEFRLLLTLAQKPGWVFTRSQLLDELWGDEKVVIDRTIDVHITHLRAKLGRAGQLIQNVRGVGYKIEAQH
jgi:two-component system phosphate regulon response regulator PhoB/two-component system alkaline phosphatase synthesis response regulator PhoP|uniref:Response regulator n=1 Tax=candidate division WOR-3 bacterium TaxID=2052148 RepID=A0A7V3PSH2_UNCW3